MRFSAGTHQFSSGDLVAVHAAIANGVDRATLHLPDGAVGDGGLRELESVAVAAWLWDDEQAESRDASWLVQDRLRASSISTSARAPNVHHVLTPLMT